MLFRNIRKIWEPASYQGGYHRKAYFEGWYYKLANRDGNDILAFIPGVSFDEKGQNTHAFIQFIHNSGTTSHYFRYDIRKFAFSENTTTVTIGDSSFNPQGIEVNIDDGVSRISGKLVFQDIKPWPVSLFLPGAMGWYAFVPFMECYHAVLSFDHAITGKLEIDGSSIDFSGGRGYIEKDWGKSFPRYHIWIQTNHFEKENTSLMASVANVPWLGKSFDGFLIGFWHECQLYRFTTYNGAKITLFRYDNNNLVIHAVSRTHRIEIEVRYQKGVELATPVKGEMRGRLSESLSASTRVRFFKKAAPEDRLVFVGTGEHTGLEIEGKLPSQ